MALLAGCSFGAPATRSSDSNQPSPSKFSACQRLHLGCQARCNVITLHTRGPFAWPSKPTQTPTLPRSIDHEATGSEIGSESRHDSVARAARTGVGAAAGDAIEARPGGVPRPSWQLPS